MKFGDEKSEPIPSPAPQEENPFKAFVGVFPAFSSVEEINSFYRDLRDDDSGYSDGQ